MIALRLLLVAALAFTANAGEDLKLAYKLSDCLQKTMVNGLPSAQIPSHCPLRINHNVSWNGDIGIASGTFDLYNIVWHGIPHWTASIEQLSEDSDSVAVLPFAIKWPTFRILSKYILETNVALIPGKLSGDLNITLTGNVWEGVVNFTKPGFDLTEGIEYLDLKWTVETVDFNFTGLGIFNEAISNSMGNGVKTFLDSGAMKNALGEGLQERLNTAWFEHNERIDAILEFCEKNSTVSH